MKRLLLALGFLVAFLARPSQAQQAPKLTSLDISLWPEYDRPDVLVIYRGLYAAETPLPIPVELRIPSRVSQPTAVAYVGQGGQPFNQQYTTRVEGGWLVVSFELETQGFQLEYYDTLPIDSSGQREYDYTLMADYPISALNLEFQVPATADSFALDPAADSVVQKQDGLTYHLVEAGYADQGESRSWTFTYTKADSTLTIEALGMTETPVSAALPATEGGGNAAAEDRLRGSVGVFLVAFVALLAVGAGAFWLGRRTQPVSETASLPSRKSRRRGSGRGSQAQRHRLGSGTPQGEAVSGTARAQGSGLGEAPLGAPQQPASFGRDEVLFCSRCGAELRPDAGFCHRCGAAVRRT